MQPVFLFSRRVFQNTYFSINPSPRCVLADPREKAVLQDDDKENVRISKSLLSRYRFIDKNSDSSEFPRLLQCPGHVEILSFGVVDGDNNNKNIMMACISSVLITNYILDLTFELLKLFVFLSR